MNKNRCPKIHGFYLAESKQFEKHVHGSLLDVETLVSPMVEYPNSLHIDSGNASSFWVFLEFVWMWMRVRDWHISSCRRRRIFCRSRPCWRKGDLQLVSFDDQLERGAAMEKRHHHPATWLSLGRQGSCVLDRLPADITAIEPHPLPSTYSRAPPPWPSPKHTVTHTHEEFQSCMHYGWRWYYGGCRVRESTMDTLASTRFCFCRNEIIIIFHM